MAVAPNKIKPLIRNHQKHTVYSESKGQVLPPHEEKLVATQFSGYYSQLNDCILRIENSLKEIFYLAQGGTAVGTGINTKRNFDTKICKEISKLTKIKFYPAKNKFAALAAHDAIVNFSGTLNTTAVCLMKIANDIRFLGSGPRAGYGLSLIHI